MKQKFTLLLLLAFFIGTAANAQVEKIIEPGAGFLDDLIVGDTATDGTRLSDIYVLKRDAEYLVQGPFENRGWKLHIKAEDGTGKIPYVQVFAQVDGTINGNLITLYGDGEFENIYFDCQGADPAARPAGRVFRSEFEGCKLDVRGCTFANCSQNGVMLPKATEYCKIDNCLFVNQGRFAFSDYGNGRVFDCRDSEIDLFSLTNSTFVNNVDRIVRHRGGSGVMKEVIVDHNTIVNSMCYHGFIELGNIGTSVKITNNLMVDCMGLGSDSTDAVRLSELDAHGEVDGAGNARMVWIGSIPNDVTSFDISNNIYTVTAAQQTWYESTGFVDEGPNWILTEHIKGKLGAGAATAWMKKDFTLPDIPDTPVDFYEYYWSPTGSNKQKETTALVDYDTRDTDYWMNTLDCKLETTDTDFMGSDGVAVGDPNWGSIVTMPDMVEKIIEPGLGFLDDIIVGDTATDGSRLSDVYVLKRGAEYLVQGPFENRGWKLHIKAEDGTGDIPYVQVFAQVDGTINGNLITLYGDGEFENIYFDCQGADPAARPAGRVFRSEFEGCKLDVRGCTFANCSQNGVMLPKATEYCKIDNCLFVNQGRFAFSDYGNGRVFDCRDSEIDLFSLTNSTFVNNVDRIVRHRGGSGVMKEVIVDHNTIVNSMCYHGFIELGNIGTSVKITNNLMVDCMGLGSDSTDAVRLSELDAHGEVDGAGNARMVWIGSIPNDVTSFDISNNIYTVTAAQQTWYESTGFVDEGPNWILTEHIKGKLGAGAATAWMKKDFTLPDIPDTPVDFYEYYWSPTGSNKQKETTALVDYDTRDTDYWMNTLDCKLETTDADFNGSDGVVVGDPRWESTVTGISQFIANGIEMTSYPNPVTDQFTLRFALDEASSVTIDIYDITGKTMRRIEYDSYGAGENSIVIERESLNSGIYILKMNAGNRNGIMKISVN